MGSAYSYCDGDPWKKRFYKEGDTFAEYRWYHSDNKFHLCMEIYEEAFVNVTKSIEIRKIYEEPELVRSSVFIRKEKQQVTEDFVKVKDIIESKLPEATKIIRENQVRTRRWWSWCRCYDVIMDYELAAAVLRKELVPTINSKLGPLGYTVNTVAWREHRIRPKPYDCHDLSFVILRLRKLNNDINIDEEKEF
jgi:hypothetical protein